MATTWDATFEALPAAGEDPSLGDDRIRTFKSATAERLIKEHYHDLTEGGSQPRQGLHRAGSAVTFYQAAAPTQRNGIALAAADNGLIWVDSDTMVAYMWVTDAWIPLVSDYTADYRFQGKIERITSGAGNWTVPAGVYRIRVTCVGGGGAGSAGSAGLSGGGGGGTNISLVLGTVIDVTPATDIAYSVGAAGQQTTFAGATTGAAGSAGAANGLGGAGPAGGAGSGGGSGSASGGGAGGGAGGVGGYSSTIMNGTVGSAGNYGGGGGGGGFDSIIGYNGGAGGSGIIIIEY